MKIIEGMKEIKRLEEKVADLITRINKYCADWDFENPTYPDQKKEVGSWVQSVHDTLKEAARLRLYIQKTNLATEVAVELGGQSVKKSIAEWIIRRRLYCNKEQSAWTALSDKGLAIGNFKSPTGDQKEFKIRLYYDPIERDKNIELYRGEPGIIDRTLEVVNATTDLLE